MSEAPGRSCTEFEELRHQGQQAVEAGRLEEAAALFDQALASAREEGDQRLIDLGVCNRAAALIDLGRGADELPRLREILLRNTEPVSCRIAAYNIARHYELTKNYKKALFYARIAHDRSVVLGRRDWIASSHNLIGNTLLAESFLKEACEQYEQALSLIPEEPSAARARILDNLGYCRVLQGRHREGFPLLYESLSLLRRFQAERYEISTRLDLCFAHLETGRYRHAWRHGAAALALAERMDEPDSVKNALYLLGEVANLQGDLPTARGYFSRLQQDFYPDAGYLPGFLLAVDVRKLINLHA
jgi:tetratricopeptide (TPR) repeat protein